MRYYLFCFNFIFVFLLMGCGPHSLEDFREEGESISRSLIKELKSIQTRDHLLQSIPRLQKLFDRLVDRIIAAREFKEKHTKLEGMELTKKNHDLSDQLRIELNRIYTMEGGRDIIEKCQEKALHRLDAFEKRLNKVRKI